MSGHTSELAFVEARGKSRLSVPKGEIPGCNERCCQAAPSATHFTQRDCKFTDIKVGFVGKGLCLLH